MQFLFLQNFNEILVFYVTWKYRHKFYKNRKDITLDAI